MHRGRNNTEDVCMIYAVCAQNICASKEQHICIILYYFHNFGLHYSSHIIVSEAECALNLRIVAETI